MADFFSRITTTVRTIPAILRAFAFDEKPPAKPSESAWGLPPSETPAVGGWKPLDIMSAVEQAAEGDFSMMTDFIVYVLRADDRVGGAMFQRTQGLVGLALTFASDDNPNISTATEAAINEDWRFIVSDEELVRILTWGIEAGFCLVEAQWKQTPDTQRWVPSLRAWSPKWCHFSHDRQEWSVQTSTGEEIIDFSKGKWFLFAPGGVEEPWKEGLWRRLAWWVLAKKFAQQYWARYSEANGSPTWLLTGAEGWDESRRSKAAKIFAGMGRDKAIGLPKGVQAELVEAKSPNWQGFQQLVNEANSAISISILAQNLTTEVKQGAKASTTVHAAIANDVLRADARNLSNFLRHGPLLWWTRLNFPKGAVVPSPTWDTTPPQDVQTQSEAQKNVATLMLALQSVKGIDFLQLLKNYQIPVKPGVTEINFGAAPVEPPPGTNPPTDPQK